MQEVLLIKNIGNYNHLLQDVYSYNGMQLKCSFVNGFMIGECLCYSFPLSDYDSFSIFIPCDLLASMDKLELFHIFINCSQRVKIKNERIKILSGANYFISYTKLFLSFDDYRLIKHFQSLSEKLYRLQNAELFDGWEDFKIKWEND